MEWVVVQINPIITLQNLKSLFVVELHGITIDGLGLL